MQLLYRILGFVFLVPGVATVLAARTLVKKYNLFVKQKIDYSHEMTDEERDEYRITRAVVDIKLIGLLISLPGIVFVLMGFK